ncbi:MAG: hypothetical protein V1743_05280 [Nanoarchaeota archaeon]
MNRTTTTQIQASKKPGKPGILALFVLIAFLALVTSVKAEFIVNAYANEFSIQSSTDNLKVCSCGIKDDIFIITNIGNLDATFTIETASAINDWISLPETSFFLNAGDSKQAHVYIKAPCATVGSYTYTLKVKTNYGREKEFVKPVLLTQCMNIKSMLTYFEKNYNPCQTAKFDLEIENIGTFIDQYSLSLGQYDAYAKLSENNIALNPGEKKTVFIYLQLACEKYGIINIPFLIHTQTNNADQQINFDMNINRAYDYMVKAEKPAQVCSKVVSTIPVTFTNNAGMPNDYLLDYRGPAFTTFEPSTLHLEPQETKVIDIFLKPSVYDEKEHQIQLKTVSQLGTIAHDETFPITVSHCYEHAISIVPKYEASCCGKKSYTVNVQNNGMFAETFYFKLKSPLLARFSQDTMTLQPSENKDLQLEIDIPCVDDYFEVRVIAESAQTGLTAEDVLTLNSLTTYSCHKIDVLNDQLKINYQTKEKQVSIKNAGTEPGTYDFSLNSHFYTLEQGQLTLAPGEIKNISLNITNINAFNKGVYLDELTGINQETGFEYKETIKTSLGKKSIIVRGFEHLFTTTLCLVSFLILILGIIIALVIIFYEQILRMVKREDKTLFFKRVPYKTNERWRLFIVLLLVFTILFALAYGVSVKPKPALVQKPLYYELYENSQLRVNVSSYFYDPDQTDVLQYSNQYVQNINIKYDKDFAVIRPDENFYGERQVTFIADDREGGRVESAVITLKVIDVPTKTIKWLLVNYCLFFFLGALFVIFLAVFFYHTSKGRYSYYFREKRKKAENY